MERLLRIDVEAEIRKLTGQRFRTAGDYAVALLRWIARRRPLRIDVEISGARLSLRHDGEGPPRAAMRNLAVLLDPEKPPEERHEALVAVEDEEPGLLAAFSPRGAVVRVATLRGDRPAVFEYARGGRARRIDAAGGERPGIEVRARGRDPRLERVLLEEAARHSIVPVTIDGERVSRGLALDDVLLHVDLRNERMRGVAGLPLRSDLVRILRLEHGIRVEEKILPSVGGLVLHAVVDESDDAFDETMGTLRRAGRRLYARLAEMYGGLEGAPRGRAFELLSQRYGHTHEPQLLSGVRAFEVVGGTALDLEGVRALAAEGPLRAIPEGEPSKRYDVSGRPVLRLTPAQHRFLESELCLRIVPAPLRREERGPGARLASWWRGLFRAIRPPLGGRPGRALEDAGLMPEEKAFIEAVRAEVRSGAFSLPGEARPFGLRFRMADGQGRPLVRIDGAGRPNAYSVSRDHPLVRSMVAAFAADRGYLYPALAALAHGHDGYAENREQARRQAT